MKTNTFAVKSVCRPDRLNPHTQPPSPLSKLPFLINNKKKFLDLNEILSIHSGVEVRFTSIRVICLRCPTTKLEWTDVRSHDFFSVSVYLTRKSFLLVDTSGSQVSLGRCFT